MNPSRKMDTKKAERSNQVCLSPVSRLCRLSRQDFCPSLWERGQKYEPKADYFLSGKLYCGKCGCPMKGVS
ncbi:MAG: hypothetical protein ACI4JC_01355, partial [Faecalibacterium sp.]